MDMENRSRSRGVKAAENRIPGGKNMNNNLPGILITALFVLVEGWFFFRLIRLKIINGTLWFWLITVGLVILGGLVGFLCWNIKKRIRFFIGAALALLGSVVLIIGTGVIDKAHNSIRSWDESPADLPRTVSMGIYVLKEDSAYQVFDLNGAVIGIMETIDREESEQVLDEMSRSLTEPLSVRTFLGFGEVIQALYKGEIRAAVLEKGFLDILKAQSEYADVEERVRLLADYQAERPTQPTTVQGESAASTAADATAETAEDPQHGTRSWKIIKVQTTEAEVTESVETGGEPETSWEEYTTTTYPEGPIETEPPYVPTTAAPWIGVPEGQEGRIFTIYITGIDSRGGGLSDRGNSDVNILAVVNMNTKQVLLLSTPRDFFVPFPMAGGTRDKLTHAGWYSVDASRSVLKNLYGVDCQYYFRVGFEGLKTLVNALGGVTVQSAYEFDTEKFHFVVGPNEVNGTQALAFARHRTTLPGGDRARGSNQMALIKAVVQKLASSSTLKNLSEVMDAVGGLARTSVPYDTLAAFSQSLINGDSWNIAQYSVNGSNGIAYSFSLGYEAYVMYPDYSTVTYAQSLIRQIYNGEYVNP